MLYKFSDDTVQKQREQEITIMDALKQEEIKPYLGDPSIYSDGSSLEIFPIQIDKINGREPTFIISTVVYLQYNNKILMLNQTKDNKVVDTPVGLGGKVKVVVNGKVCLSEKVALKQILSYYKLNNLSTEESLRKAVVRETYEETSGYKINKSGKYTHRIIKSGLLINYKSLMPIGISKVRIISNNKTECWLIQHYMYNLKEKEYEFIQNKVEKSNREGELVWFTIEEAVELMSYSDRSILGNNDTLVMAEEIRDKVNNNNISRISVKKGPIELEETIINDDIASSSVITPMYSDKVKK